VYRHHAPGAAARTNRAQDALGGDRLIGHGGAERRQRIVDGVEDRRGRARGAGLARALVAAGDRGRRRLEVVQLERGTSAAVGTA